MKKIYSLCSTIIFVLIIHTSNFPLVKKGEIKDKFETFNVSLVNPANVALKNGLVEIRINNIKAKYHSFNEYNFFVAEGKVELPSQTVDLNGDGIPDEIAFLVSLSPKQKKDVNVFFSPTGKVVRSYTQMAQAELGIKADYKLVNGEYTGGHFQNIDSTVVPKDHFAHDALYRIEGPGWESDLIAYRFYLDSRNRNDITGKKTHDMIIQKMGVNDLVSNSQESYTKMLDWGMDIFKVGESLGIGSIAIWQNGKVNTISKVEKEECKIIDDGPIQAGILTKYFGWQVGHNKYNLASKLSINCGSRLTKVDLQLKGKTALLCTGLAKHEGCTFLKSNNNKAKWGYIGLYGKQSLAGDNLGIAVFYNLSNLKEITEDSLSHIIILNPANGKLNYYFAAAWEQEPNGIKNISEFKDYLNQKILELSEPIQVSF